MSSTAANARPPWPAKTPDPSPPLRRKRQSSRRPSRLHAPSSSVRRDDIADQPEISQALDQCFDENNAVYSCFPTSDTVIPQHEWAAFVWNSRIPYFTETDLVNIYLYHGDSLEPVLNATNVVNPVQTAGEYTSYVNDTWFGARGANWQPGDGNISYPFYWVITPNTITAVNQQTPLATFTAVQTTYADSVASSLSSASAASSLSSASAASAASVASSRSAASASSLTTTATSGVSTVGTGVGGGTNGNSSSTINPSSRQSGPSSSSSAGSASGSAPGSVQQDQSNKFPDWAIAVIVVLGFLALAASGVLAFYLSRRMRNRRMLSHRGSMNSASPMMANAATGNTAQSPLLGAAALGAAAGGEAAAAGAGSGEGNRPTSPTEGHDGASTLSRNSDGAPFSGADAAIMAAAFRTALRNADFSDENESPESNNTERPSALLAQELAEEGRDIRSVGSSRGVRVETLSDSADDDGATTVQEDPH
ncbi:hypothetical protein WOLCODRAFT_136758 [Wolfiporia cocos MD-104 SS10]|uniref:Uncharacterized protein n=1 Tax=Wolfiporia cocos (strain MD-104) TaxID=742152 RepID=A0A2H3JU86_WOLCO|nr:hypothetical protein WOLCODRAFT_136758 [Wolfiporia cocos MD-104 SS10]